MPNYDFAKGTVESGGHRFNFAEMSAEELAARLTEGVPADNLRKLTSVLAQDAESQLLLDKWTSTILHVALNAVTTGGTGGLTGLIAAVGA